MPGSRRHCGLFELNPEMNETEAIRLGAGGKIGNPFLIVRATWSAPSLSHEIADVGPFPIVACFVIKIVEF